MKEVGQGLTRIGRPHEGFPHQKCIHMRFPHFLDICCRQNTAFSDQYSVGGHIFQHAQGGIQAHLKAFKVAVVDAHQAVS
jgi:hypothetical protein